MVYIVDIIYILCNANIYDELLSWYINSLTSQMVNVPANSIDRISHTPGSFYIHRTQS